MAGAPPADAREIHGVPFDETLEIAGRRLFLRGLAVKQVTMLGVDVYAAGLYCEPRELGAAEIRASECTKVVLLEFLRDVSHERLAATWMAEFAKNCVSEPLYRAAERIAGRLPDARKGERIGYVMSPGRVDVLVGSNLLDSLIGEGADHAVLSSFVGERAPRRLREELLRRLSPP